MTEIRLNDVVSLYERLVNEKAFGKLEQVRFEHSSLENGGIKLTTYEFEALYKMFTTKSVYGRDLSILKDSLSGGLTAKALEWTLIPNNLVELDPSLVELNPTKDTKEKNKTVYAPSELSKTGEYVAILKDE